MTRSARQPAGLTRHERWYGSNAPPRELRWLRVGDMAVALDGSDLRYLRLGGLELVRRVYVAVRDLNWDTIGEVERQTTVAEQERGFVVRSRVRSQRGPIRFVWDGVAEGHEDGTLTYSVDGRCEARFQFAKIGICVHHPSRECAGRPYTATTPAGVTRGSLPVTIAPQVVDHAKGYELPLFDPFSALSIELADGLAVDFAFEGQLFEMEDQRNWTDASLKTASTPAYLGFVHDAEVGLRIRQCVRIRVRRARRHIRRQALPVVRSGQETVLTLGGGLGRRLPPIGFGLPSDRTPHTESEANRIRALRPSHLRGDLRADDSTALERALAECARLGTKLELALHVDSHPRKQVAELQDVLRGAPLARILLFQDGQACTPRAAIDHVRARLPADVPVIGGTNIYFCDINRDRPKVAGLGGIAYSINPQVHAFDELSLVEALAGQAETVLSARQVFSHVPIIVSPVTLRPRFNPVALTEALASDEPELPAEVDPRQMSQFGAVWTLGSVAALSGSGASSLTYYETVGWRGLFERDDGNPQPTLFRSLPGMLFPIYHLFMLLRDARDAELISLASDEPLHITGLAYRLGGEISVVLGNLTHKSRRITMAPSGLSVSLAPYSIDVVTV